MSPQPRPNLQRFHLIPLLLTLLLFTACGDLEGSAITQPDDNVSEDSAVPTGDFGVSETFGGPYLSDADGAITDASDARVVSVAPGGSFFVQVDYEDPSGITTIAVNLVNSSPEGLAGTLDPTQSFFTLGEPTGISEPSGCDLSANPTSVTCIYEVRVAEDAVNISELEGAGDEFAYVFRTQVTDAAGNTSDEAERGYVVVTGGDGEPEPTPEPETCTNPVEIPDELLRKVLRENLRLGEDATITCEDLANLIDFSFEANDGENRVMSFEGLQYAVNLRTFTVPTLFVEPEQLEPLRNLTRLEVLTTAFVFREGDNTPTFLENLTNLKELSVRSIAVLDPEPAVKPELNISPLQNLTKLTNLRLSFFDINDLSPLQNLTSLTRLNLTFDDISDITPLVNNEGLSEGDTVNLRGNSLETCPDTEDRADINALIARGVDVLFDEPENCDADGGDGGDGFIRVTTTSGAASLEDECTLRAAITAANADEAVGGCPAGSGADAIVLSEGDPYLLTEVDNETEGENGLPAITSEIELLGTTGAEIIRAEGTPGFRILYVAEGGNLSVVEVVISGGSNSANSPFGGGIFNAGTLTLENDTALRNNTGIVGVGLYNRGEATVRNSLITENEGSNGAGFYNAGTLTMISSEVTSNSDGDATGFYNEGTLTIEASRIENNETSATAGAFINAPEGVIEMTRVDIIGNSDDGSTVINRGEMTLTEVVYDGNSDGVNNFEGGTLNLIDSTVSNTGLSYGPGLTNSGTLRVENSTFTGNPLGGIANADSGTAEITNSVVQGNGTDDDKGVGISNTGTLTLSESTVSNHTGGGILNVGLMEIDASTIEDNGPFVDGIVNTEEGTLTLTRSLIDGNGSYGVRNGGGMTFTNNTVLNNFTGGVKNLATGELEVAFSSIFGFGSGFITSISNEADAASVTVLGTFLDTEFDFGCGPNDALTSRGYNYYNSDEVCSFTQETDIVGEAFPFGLLQDNGGPTLTRALEADSVAVDYIPADVCNVDTDQRGVSRPQGEACDIGAFELEQ